MMRIQPKYISMQDAPMTYYKFLTKFSLLAGMLLNLVRFFISIISFFNNYFWGYVTDAAVLMAAFILCAVSLTLLNQMEWRGVIALFSISAIEIIYCLALLGLMLINGAGWEGGTLLGTATGYSAILVINWIYFSKRRLLFAPSPKWIAIPPKRYETKELEPAAQEISLSYQSDFKIKHHSEPIDTRTFRICPGCGSLILTDDLTCNCGHVFQKTKHKIGLQKLLLSCLTVVLVLCGSSYASYRLGQNSMSDELQHQYSEGQKEGSRNGYKIGYHDAKVSYESSAEYEFESGYRTAMADLYKETRFPSSVYIIRVRSELHDTLSAEYGVSPFIPKPNFVQPAPSQSSSNVSGYDSSLGKTGTALDKYSLDKYSLDKYRLK